MHSATPLKQSWASLASEQDLDDFIPSSLRSEFTDVDDDLGELPSFSGFFPSPSSANVEDGYRPRSLRDPVFGFTFSPFAPSPEQIRSLEKFFDDYVPPPPESPSRKHQSSETPSEKEQMQDWVLKTLEKREESGDQSSGIPAVYPSLPPLMPPPPPPPPPPMAALGQPLPLCLAPCVQCGSRHVTQTAAGVVQCLHCGLLEIDPWMVPPPPPPPAPKNNASRQGHSKPHGNRRSRGKHRAGLLLSFKQRNGNGYRLSDMWGHMIFLSRDQNGSRFLQKELARATPADQVRYFNEISHQALTIASDVFGNFILQVLLESGNPTIESKLVQIIKPHMIDLSTRPFGCRVVQKAIETLSYQHKLHLAASLEGNVETCAHNEHGNHVIQRCLQYIQPQDVAFVYSSIAEKARTMSRDRYGCRVVQRAIEHRHPEDYAAPIRRQIVSHAVEFSFDEFANFVVQKLLLNGSSEAVERVAASFMPHLFRLSCQKYPSNVVEAVVSVCSPETAQRIKRVLLGLDMRDSRGQLTALIRDRFGRYVVEKLIKLCTEEERAMIRDRAREIVRSVNQDASQKSVVKRMQRLLQAL